MDYEKKYNDALNLAKSYYGKGSNEFLDTIFPELSESEDNLIGSLGDPQDEDAEKELEEMQPLALAYLEKQKEPKNTSASVMAPSCWEVEQKEQKPEWSEEDERKRQACISTINEVIDYERERWEDYNPGKPYRPIMKYDEQIDWLKSLRPQPHWKPSEEQMEVDLEKEIDACWQNWLSPSNQNEVEGVLPKTEFAAYARHFYELGLKAREKNK